MTSLAQPVARINPGRLIVAALVAAAGAACVQILLGAVLAPDSRVSYVWHDRAWPQGFLFTLALNTFFLFPLALFIGAQSARLRRGTRPETFLSRKGIQVGFFLAIAGSLLLAWQAVLLTDHLPVTLLLGGALLVFSMLFVHVRWPWAVAVLLAGVTLPFAAQLRQQANLRYVRLVDTERPIVWIDRADSTVWVSKGAAQQRLYGACPTFARWRGGVLIAVGNQLFALDARRGRREISLQGLPMDGWVIVDLLPLRDEVMLRVVNQDADSQQIVRLDPDSGAIDLLTGAEDVRGTPDTAAVAVRTDTGAIELHREGADPRVLLKSGMSVASWDYDPSAKLLALCNGRKVTLMTEAGKTLRTFWPGRRIVQVRFQPALRQLWVAEGYSSFEPAPWRLLAYDYAGHLLGTRAFVGRAVHRNMTPADATLLRLLPGSDYQSSRE